jgi:hypothetical protein
MIVFTRAEMRAMREAIDVARYIDPMLLPDPFLASATSKLDAELHTVTCDGSHHRAPALPGMLGVGCCPVCGESVRFNRDGGLRQHRDLRASR